MMARWGRRSVLVLFFLGACTGSAQVRPSEGNRHASSIVKLDRFALEVQVPSTSGSGWNLLANGGTLRSGDRYSLNLSVAEPLYLYAEQQSKSGTQWRWPRAGESAAVQEPTRPLLIPETGFLTLDTKPGMEWIFVVAATSPLSDEQLGAELQRLAKEARRNEPANSNSQNRGEPVRGGLDSRGIGGISFKINHE